MDYRDRISRWVLAIGLWGCALWLANYGYQKLELSWLFPALILAVIGVIRVFRDILELAARPFTMIIDAIIFPKVQGGKPPPNYKLAEHYLEEERWDDAEAEYRMILRNHPREREAYLGLMRLLVEMGETAESKKIHKKAQRYLRNQPDDLSEIEMEWQHLEKQFSSN